MAVGLFKCYVKIIYAHIGNDLWIESKGMSFLPRIKYGVNSSRNPESSFTDTFI